MRFVFSRRFFILLAAGFVPLSLSWNFPILRSLVLAYDVLLVLLALVDWFMSRKLPEDFTIRREFARRFAIGDETEIHLHVENRTSRDFTVILKDEFPPEL